MQKNANGLTDEQLVIIVRDKDKEKFAEIIARYQNKIISYLYRLVGDRENSQDLAQEVFLKTYKNLNGFDIRRKFSSWLYRIAHNEAVNFLRFSTNRKVVSIDQNEYLKNTLGKSDGIEEKLDKKSELVKLKQIVDQLPLKYREPIILKFYEDRSYEEISNILRIPINTVGTLVSRGKEKLKK